VKSSPPDGLTQAGSISDETWREAVAAGKSLLESGPDVGTLLRETQGWLVALLRSGALSSSERVEAGNILAEIGDPRFRADAFYLPDEPLLGFVEIPAGSFMMGEGQQRHEVTLPTFYIGRYHVTVAQFRAFVEESGVEPGTPDTLRGRANHPVVWVSWYEARKYCEWLTRKLAGLSLKDDMTEREQLFWQRLRRGSAVVTLPSETEWEKAARGEEGSTYPWGDEIDSGRANYRDTGIGTTSPVGCFPAGLSPYGVADMSGNTWNWMRSLMGRDLKELEFGYPYNPSDGRENLDAAPEVLRGMRGGAFPVEPERARSAFRDGVPPSGRDDADGFRLVVTPVTSKREEG